MTSAHSSVRLTHYSAYASNRSYHLMLIRLLFLRNLPILVLKVNKIRSIIDSNTSSSSITPSDNSNIQFQYPFHQFKELSEEEIVSLVSSAPNKSCILDPIPTSLVKSSLPNLAPILTKIVNGSLFTGHFPSPWKRAIILKKM